MEDQVCELSAGKGEGAPTTGRPLRTVNGPVQSAWPHAASPYVHCPLPELRQVNRALTSGWGG